MTPDTYDIDEQIAVDAEFYGFRAGVNETRAIQAGLEARIGRIFRPLFKAVELPWVEPRKDGS